MTIGVIKCPCGAHAFVEAIRNGQGDPSEAGLWQEFWDWDRTISPWVQGSDGCVHDDHATLVYVENDEE